MARTGQQADGGLEAPDPIARVWSYRPRRAELAAGLVALKPRFEHGPYG
jgi:hypothetical protein